MSIFKLTFLPECFQFSQLGFCQLQLDQLGFCQLPLDQLGFCQLQLDQLGFSQLGFCCQKFSHCVSFKTDFNSGMLPVWSVGMFSVAVGSVGILSVAVESVWILSVGNLSLEI